MARPGRNRYAGWSGFTLIELLVVLAIIAMLAAVVSPRYFKSIERAQAVSLQTTLKTVRDALDKFAGDQARYPDSLEELVRLQYLREIPMDPVAESKESWLVTPPSSNDVLQGGVADIHSGAQGTDTNGVAYRDY